MTTPTLLFLTVVNLTIICLAIVMGTIIRPLPWWMSVNGEDYIALKKEYDQGKKEKTHYLREALFITSTLIVLEFVILIIIQP